MRILMLVINPMTADTRVDKEAAALAAAGHEVTVVALAAAGLPFREARRGFEIVRLPYRRTLRETAVSPWQRARIQRHELAAARDALAGVPATPGESVVAALGTASTVLRTLASGVSYGLGGLALKTLRTRTLVPSYRQSIAARIPGVVARPDVVHVHDLGPLAAGVWLARGWTGTGPPVKVVYDSHELYVEQQTSWTPRERRMWEWHERRWIRHADMVVTVSDSIARELQGRYDLPRCPTVVLNSPPADHVAHDSDVRTDLGLEGERLAVYVGAAKRGRGVDRLVDALGSSSWHLALVGAGEGPEIDDLARRAAAAGMGDRLHRLPGVPAATLPDYLATADVGVHPMEPTCRNHELALPNKLFDYLFAGLPVAVSDLPEMGGLVTRHDLGEVFDPSRPATIVAALDAAAARPHGAPRELLAQLGWERQAARLLAGYSDILGVGHPSPSL